MSIYMWKNSTPIQNQELGTYTGFWGTVCVYMCVRVRVCMCVRARACVCVCARARVWETNEVAE